MEDISVNVSGPTIRNGLHCLHRGVWAGLFIDKSRFTLSACNISMTSLVVGQWWSKEPNLRRDWQASTVWATAHWVPFGIRMKSSDRLYKPPGPYAGAVGPGILLVLDNAQPHVARAWWQFLKDIIQFSFSYIGRNHSSSHLKSFYRMKELIPWSCLPDLNPTWLGRTSDCPGA